MNSLFKLRASGDTKSNHILVIRNSDENIEQDITKPERGKKARISKQYGPDYMVYTYAELWQETDEMDSPKCNKT